MQFVGTKGNGGEVVLLLMVRIIPCPALALSPSRPFPELMFFELEFSFGRVSIVFCKRQL